jgi:hypothetical protein
VFDSNFENRPTALIDDLDEIHDVWCIRTNVIEKISVGLAAEISLEGPQSKQLQIILLHGVEVVAARAQDRSDMIGKSTDTFDAYERLAELPRHKLPSISTRRAAEDCKVAPSRAGGPKFRSE